MVVLSIALLLAAAVSRAAAALSDNIPVLGPQIPIQPPNEASHSAPLEFSLKHIFHHGAHRYPKLHKRLDVEPDNIASVTADDGESVQPAPRLTSRRQPVTIERLVDRSVPTIEQHLRSARRDGYARITSPEDWTLDEVEGPDVSDKETVLALARMAANAYIMVPGTEKWVDVSGPFNYSRNFGWEDDGLRGHIYADSTNSTIVVSLKGTSTALFDGEGTTTNDKLNDNLFFSCCCGQGGPFLWRQVCDCATGTYTCNSTCLGSALRAENRYYRAALDLYANITSLYPKSNIWLVGHSLGGAVSSMLGQTYGLPVVTFEAVPEALPSSRLGLPSPPGRDPRRPQRNPYSGAYHFGHTADPVYMGTCNGLTSTCTLAGYAMESSCHTGYRCVYDTVEDMGWRSGIGTHRILAVIRDVIEKYDTVPECKRDTECVDCFNWKFDKGNHSTSTSTRTSTPHHTKTRTSTCKTPGWWGCLDPTTTTTPTSTETSTSTSTTCHTPGWFGCKDPTTTESTPTSTTTSTCRHPGWFGCRDPTSTAPAVTTTTAVPPRVSTTPTELTESNPVYKATMSSTLTLAPSTTTCLTPGWFYGCRDK